jgi:hypothetical protein
VEWLLGVAREYGAFVALVAWVLYDSRQREQRYLSVIETLSEEVKERLAKIEIMIKKKV